MLGFGLSAFSLLSARGDSPALSENPYAAIQARNAFNLVPVPNIDAADAAPYSGPAAKIIPNGLMTLFGAPQVLFKVATPVGSGQPPQIQSYVMSEGDRADGISVTRIDQSAHVITFDNHGTIQTIPIADAGVGGGSVTGSPIAAENQSADQAARGQFVRQYASSIYDSSVATPAPADSGVSSSASVADSSVTDPSHLTPEAQVILIEAQRQRLQQQGDPTAVLIPPTQINQTVPESDQSLAVGATPPTPTP
jgi:hypothetical protein